MTTEGNHTNKGMAPREGLLSFPFHSQGNPMLSADGRGGRAPGPRVRRPDPEASGLPQVSLRAATRVSRVLCKPGLEKALRKLSSCCY